MKAEPVDTPSEGASRPVDPHALIDVDAESLFVAMLVENRENDEMAPADYCLDDGKLWKGATYRLGRVNVFGVDEQLAALTPKGPVAVFGSKEMSLNDVITDQGPCPEREILHAQMRSDWIADEGGSRTTHDKLATLPYIKGTRAQLVHMHEFLDSDESTVRVRIRNPFTVPMRGLDFAAHYEGGRGKPMPTMVDKVLTLEPGATVELEIPRELEGAENTKAGSGLHTLDLTGTLGKAELDIRLFVPHR